MMDSKTFGQVAQTLLNASQIPGEQLDAAFAFREIARALADGSVILTTVSPVQHQQGNSYA